LDWRVRYEVVFAASVKEETVKLRDVKAKHIGHMVVLKAIVTRVNDVRPMMQVSAVNIRSLHVKELETVSYCR
jgi:DNA replicative helicase MCM subunit Mcm2 (Cdc46/Mcm family)